MKLNFKEGKENKIHIFIDGEYRMTADRTFIALCGYKNNSEINEQELASLEMEVSSRRAFNKACDLLSRRDHSRAELLQKLRHKGFSEGAEAALLKLSDLGYVDDRRFSENYAGELQRLKHFGKKRISLELYKKGISSDIISDVTEAIENDSDELVLILEKKYGKVLDTEKGVRRAFSALVRMGYGYAEIKEALEKIENN